MRTSWRVGSGSWLAVSFGLLAAVVASGAGCSSSSDGTPPASTPDAAAPVVVPDRATGKLTAWTTAAPMPTARANHCAVTANGFLVVIGGNYKPAGKADFLTVADVHVARMAADGSLGPWKLAGKTPSPVSSCTAAADGADLYLVDGIFDDATAGGKVRRATLGASGDLGAWQEIGALPAGVRVLYSSASVRAGRLQAFDAKLPGEGDGIALVSAALGAPALGAWQQTTWLTGFRGHPELAFTYALASGAYVYALGGYSSADTSNTVLADGAGALLDGSGLPGKSFALRALPKPTSFGQAVAVDDWLFVIGGKDGVLSGSGSPAAFAAKIGAAGALEAWSTVAPLPQGRTSHAAVVAGDFVYVTGGGFDGGGLDTVFVARVRYPAAGGAP